MRYTVASLRCVPQSMQGVHCVIQSLFLFDVVSGYMKQLPCPYHKCFLCLRNAVWESGLINARYYTITNTIMIIRMDRSCGKSVPIPPSALLREGGPVSHSAQATFGEVVIY